MKVRDCSETYVYQNMCWLQYQSTLA